MLEKRHINDLVRIAAAGGGFELEAKLHPTDQLVRIAAAASGKGARIVFRGLNMRETNDLVRIAAAGAGAVSFA